MGNTIQGTFGWDISPVIEGMKNAEDAVNNGSKRIQNKFGQIFKRSPNMRAERAISGSLQAFASGDIAGGIEAITSRMTGLGIVAGVAVGAGVAIFAKFKDQIDQTKEAANALQDDLNRPIGLLTGGTSQGIEKALESQDKHAAELTSKLQHKMGSQLLEAGQDWGKTLFPFFFGSDTKSTGSERLGQDKELDQSGERRKVFLQAQADIHSKIIQLKTQELEGDEHAARLEKIRYDYEQQRIELQKSGLSGNPLLEEQETIAKTADLARNQENARFDLKEKSLEIEEKMTALAKKGLSPSDQTKVRAGLELKSLDEQVADEKDPFRKRQLTLARDKKSLELRGMASPSQPAGPGEWGSIERRDAETNDPNVYGSLGYSAANMNRSNSPQAANTNSDVVAAIKTTNDLITKALLPP